MRAIFVMRAVAVASAVEAATALGTFVIGATFGAYPAVLHFAANQAVATVELWWPVAPGRRYLQQAALLAEPRTARFVAHAGAVVAALADVAIGVVAAFRADQLIVDTTVHLP